MGSASGASPADRERARDPDAPAECRRGRLLMHWPTLRGVAAISTACQPCWIKPGEPGCFSPPPQPSPHQGGGRTKVPSPLVGEGEPRFPPPWWGEGEPRFPPPWWGEGEPRFPPPWWGRVGVGGCFSLPPCGGGLGWGAEATSTRRDFPYA